MSKGVKGRERAGGGGVFRGRGCVGIMSKGGE